MAVKTEARPRTAEIRPFTIEVPEADLKALRARIAATRWPEKQTVGDQSQGVPLETSQALARYWEKEYDWRKVEARLNALPNFITEIDGLDIHFLHIRSKHEDALPLIVTHGWPGSIIEQLKIVGPLTDPTAHGADASDAFHLVIPSLPGFGFSGKPTQPGWGPERIASAWIELMRRLGYSRFVAQGGDWGALITDVIALQRPPELAGIHTNMPGVVPPDIDTLLQSGISGATDPLASLPPNLSDEEKRCCEKLAFFWQHSAYALMMGTRPETLTGFADSPIALASYMIDHDAASLDLICQAFAGKSVGLTRDDVLDNVHALLADEHGKFRGPHLLGEQALVLRRQGRHRPGCRERLPDRDVPGAEELGGAGVFQSHPLQQGGEGWALRGLGAAADPVRRAAHRLPVASLTDPGTDQGPSVEGP